LKLVFDINQQMNKFFKNKISDSNRALSQMRAGNRLESNRLDMSSRATKSKFDILQETEYGGNREVKRMLTQVKKKPIDSKTKILNQYKDLMECLDYKNIARV
jgi:hypothetical protein